MRRYMDDIILFAKSREELVRVFDGVLATLEHHDLRVNGKKVTALGTSYSIWDAVLKMEKFLRHHT